MPWGRPQSGQAQIGRWEAEAAAPASPMDDRADGEPAVAEKAVGAGDVALGQCLADFGRSDDRPVCARRPAPLPRRRNPAAARFAQHLGRAGAALPNRKSKPTTAAANASCPTSTVAMKSSAAMAAKARSKVATTRPSMPSAASRRAFAATGVRRKTGCSGRKHGARMRLEGERHRRHAAARRLPRGRVQQRLTGRDGRHRNCRRQDPPLRGLQGSTGIGWSASSGRRSHGRSPCG